MATSLEVLQLLVPIFLILLIASGISYYFARKYKRAHQSKPLLPLHHEAKLAPAQSHHRRRSSVYIPSSTMMQQSQTMAIVDPEKRQLAQASPAVASPITLPEIRITFPEETDSEGKRSSARVVVVHFDDKGAAVGMKPLADEPLPPYERFESLDLDRLGGLKEKEVKA